MEVEVPRHVQRSSHSWIKSIINDTNESHLWIQPQYDCRLFLESTLRPIEGEHRSQTRDGRVYEEDISILVAQVWQFEVQSLSSMTWTNGNRSWWKRNREPDIKLRAIIMYGRHLGWRGDTLGFVFGCWLRHSQDFLTHITPLFPAFDWLSNFLQFFSFLFFMSLYSLNYDPRLGLNLGFILIISCGTGQYIWELASSKVFSPVLVNSMVGTGHFMRELTSSYQLSPVTG